MPRVPATLELIPLGTGAAYGQPDQAQSGYLVRAGDTAVALDLGTAFKPADARRAAHRLAQPLMQCLA